MEDRFGQKIATRSTAAAQAYIAGVDIMLTARPGALDSFDAALAADPDFALGHISRARALQLQGRQAEALAARDVAKARAGAASAREAAHIGVLSRAIEGDGPGALDALRRHMRDFRRDGVVLSLAMGVYSLLGFSGMADHHQQQRDLVDALAPDWDEDWWFLGYRGWAHAETGNAAFGAPLIEQSLALFRVNGNAAHARAHAYYELGESEQGMAFLDDWLPDYLEAGSLYPHLSWHLALFALRNGQAEKAAALYESRFRPALGRQPPFFTIVDAASFNWRNLLRGIERKREDIDEVSAYAQQHFRQPGIGFANVHIAYAYAARGDLDALAAHVAGVEKLASAQAHPSAQTVLRICEGVRKYAAQDYGAAADLLEQGAAELARIGGSHAQRDGVLETLVSACFRAGRPGAAEAVLAARLGLRAIWTKPAA